MTTQPPARAFPGRSELEREVDMRKQLQLCAWSLATAILLSNGLSPALGFQDGTPAPGPQAQVRGVANPRACGDLRWLALDLRNDGVPPAERIFRESGSAAADGTASFHVYAVIPGAEGLNYVNVSAERPALQLKVRRAPRSRGGAASVRYYDSDGDPRWIVRFQGRSSVDRFAVLTATYACVSRPLKYQKEFLIHMPAQR